MIPKLVFVNVKQMLLVGNVISVKLDSLVFLIAEVNLFYLEVNCEIKPLHFLDCECHAGGRTSPQCTEEGVCKCKDGVEGDRCLKCKANHFAFPNCLGMNAQDR